VFEAQDEIGRRVVEALHSRFARVVQKSGDRYSSDPEAYADFMSGLRASYGDSLEEFRAAAEHLSRAIARDPEFALAHAWLSHVCMQMNQYLDGQRTWLVKAESHCQRALTLNPDLPEAHWARAAILWSPAKNFQHAEAIAALERVLEARPNFDRAHNRMAAICLHIGRFQEARIADDAARLSNPKHSAYNYAWIDLFSGNFTRAREAGEAWFRKAPGNKNALWFSAHALLLTGDLDTARERLAIAAEKYQDDPMFSSLEGMRQARCSQTAAALECVRRALDLPSFGIHVHHIYQNVACTYAVLGETEKAMAWLEKCVDTGNPCWPFFRVDPHLESLRQEPRFQELVDSLEREFTALKIRQL
jgi:tetratricopeptide (TPR) repeat protein